MLYFYLWCGLLAFIVFSIPIGVLMDKRAIAKAMREQAGPAPQDEEFVQELDDADEAEMVEEAEEVEMVGEVEDGLIMAQDDGDVFAEVEEL